VDVFVLGASVGRGDVLKVRLVGIIHMLDKGESDSKLLAVNTQDQDFAVTSLEMLNQSYPGVMDILKVWLMHYKGSGEVEMLPVRDEKEAITYLNIAHKAYLQQKSE
jgi:inorganic pyrophosphatase